MESCKMLLAAISVVTLSSVARTAPLNSPPSRAELLINLGLLPELTLATKEMKNLYPFIASTDLQNTMLFFGPIVTPTCSTKLQLKDKLSVPYMKLSYFVSPLYMAYSYEEIQGPQHIQLAQLLQDTSFYLNSTFTTLRHERLVITDDVVKIYRNYVILYSLRDVINQVYACVTSL